MVGIGDRLGGYELLAKLGSGGMATLYLARREGAAGFERLAAVKVVHPHLVDNQRFVLMFIDEAKLSSRIQHPNVVRVEDFGKERDTYYMAMEYVHGCSLSQLLRGLARRRMRLAPEMAVHIAQQVLAGLHAAHETHDAEGRALHLVHRDVSPQNVLVSFDGHVRLIDFGIAKASFRAYQTKSLTIKGKLAYMAPEQLAAKELDRRADVYALAIVLYELLTMRRYFEAENELMMLDLIRAPTPKSPAAHAAIGAALDAAVLRGLDPDPDARPATALDLRRELAAACPEAMLIEPTDLAAVLADIVGDLRDKADEKLPSAARQDQGLAPPAAERSRGLTRELEVEVSPQTWSEDTFDDSDAREAPPSDPHPGPEHEGGTPSEGPFAAEAQGTPTGLRRRGSGPPKLAVAAIAAVAIAGGAAAGFGLGTGGELEVAPPVPAVAAGTVPTGASGPAESRGGSDPTEDATTRLEPIVIPAAPALAPDESGETGLPREPRDAVTCAEERDHACVVELLAGRASTAEERGWLVDAYEGLGRAREARLAARDYLAHHEHGADADRMRERLGAARVRPGRASRTGPSPSPSAVRGPAASPAPAERPTVRNEEVGELPFSDSF